MDDIAPGRDSFHGLRIADIPDYTLNLFRTGRRPARIMSQCPYDIPAWRKRATKCRPMKPVAPVTRILMKPSEQERTCQCVE